MKLKRFNKVGGFAILVIGLVSTVLYGITEHYVSKLPAPLPLAGVHGLMFFSPLCSSVDGQYVFPLTDKIRTQYDSLIQNAENVSVEGPIQRSGKQIVLAPLCDGAVLVLYPASKGDVSQIVKIEKVKGEFKYKTPY